MKRLSRYARILGFVLFFFFLYFFNHATAQLISDTSLDTADTEEPDSLIDSTTTSLTDTTTDAIGSETDTSNTSLEEDAQKEDLESSIDTTTDEPKSADSSTPSVDIFVGPRRENVVAVYVEVSDATGVRLFVRRDGGMVGLLGDAARVDGVRWLYKWFLGSSPAGVYTIIPRVAIGGTIIEGSSITYTIEKTEVEISDADNALAEDIETLRRTVSDAEADLKALEKDTLEATTDIVRQYSIAVEERTGEETPDTLRKEFRDRYEVFLRDFETRLLHERQKIVSLLRRGEVGRAERRKEELAEEIREQFLALRDFSAKELGADVSVERFLGDIEASVENLEEQILRKERAVKERGGLALYLDSDTDGVSDYDELNIYLSDPLRADSDGDGIFDGEEILQGTDLTSSAPDPVTREDPREFGPAIEGFTVEKINVTETHVIRGEERARKITFTGMALPNSFVTLFIYSAPITVTVKADQSGQWKYVLEQELEDGTHEVYVATVDNSGKILAKSTPFPFIKQAAAVEVGGIDFGEAERTRPGFLSVSLLLWGGVAMFTLALMVLLVIGYRHRGGGADGDDDETPSLRSPTGGNPE